MATLFHSRFKERVAAKCQARAFGVTVTLSAGGVDSSEFTATYVDQEYESLDKRYGFPIKVNHRDFYLNVSDCVIGGDSVTPSAGMTITEGSQVFEIMPLTGRPAAELQPAQDRWLVHTKRITVDA